MKKSQPTSHSKSRGTKRSRGISSIIATTASITEAANTKPPELGVSEYSQKVFVVKTGLILHYMSKPPSDGTYDYGFDCNVCNSEFDAGVPWWHCDTHDCCVRCHDTIVSRGSATAKSATPAPPSAIGSAVKKGAKGKSSAIKKKEEEEMKQEEIEEDGEVSVSEEHLNKSATALAHGSSVGLLARQLEVLRHPSSGGEALQRVSYIRLKDVQALVYCNQVIAGFVIEANTKGFIQALPARTGGKQVLHQHCIVVEGTSEEESHRSWSIQIGEAQKKKGPAEPTGACYVLDKHWNVLRDAAPLDAVSASVITQAPSHVNISRISGGAQGVETSLTRQWEFIANADVATVINNNKGQDDKKEGSVASNTSSTNGGLKSALKKKKSKSQSVTNLDGCGGDVLTHPDGWIPMPYGGVTSPLSHTDHTPVGITGSSLQLLHLESATAPVLLSKEEGSKRGHSAGALNETFATDSATTPNSIVALQHQQPVAESAGKNPHLLCFFLTNGSIQCVDLHRRVELIFAGSATTRPKILGPSGMLGSDTVVTQDQEDEYRSFCKHVAVELTWRGSRAQ